MNTTRVTKNVNKHTKTFLRHFCMLMSNGTRYLSPVLEKGIESITRDLGNGGLWGILYGPPSTRRHTTHLFKTDFTVARPLII
jgi:hypothetical protein